MLLQLRLHSLVTLKHCGDRMLWPNKSYEYNGWTRTILYTHIRFTSLQRVNPNLAYFGNESIEETSSVPEGSFESRALYLPPIVSGGMSAANNETEIEFSQNGSMLNGSVVSGDATVDISSTAGLSLIITMNGAGDLTFDQSGSMRLVVGLAGPGSFAFSSTPSLSNIVPVDGLASCVFSVSANLKGLLSLSGDITPFTELSPENLAAAVWNAVATDYNDAGSMGEKLNDAGSAGNPWASAAVDNNDPGTMGEKLHDASAAGNPWASELSSNNTPGTFGWLVQKLLTVGRFLGLK